MVAKVLLALLLALGTVETLADTAQDDPVPMCQPGAPDCP